MSKFEDELIIALMPYIKSESLQAAKMQIQMVTHNYDIRKAEMELAVYEGDINEAMIKRFTMAKIAAGLSQRTIKYYVLTTKKFFEEMKKPYSQITPDDIRYYLAIKVQRDGCTNVTANNERRCISAFYGWLQKEEILLKNPMNKVDPIKTEKVKKKAYDLMDLEKIRLGCRGNREKAIVETLASTWCRVSELVGIRIDAIEGNKILVKGKGAKERYCFLNARAKLAIQVYLAERKDTNPYLFPKARYTVNAAEKYTKGKHRGEAWNWYMDPEMVDEKDPSDKGTVESIIRKIGKRAGVTNCHPHRFRRTGATLALRSGMPIQTVSKLLGHNSIETTQIYLDVSDDELGAAHAKYVI